MSEFFNTLSARLAVLYSIVFVFFSGLALLIFYLAISSILQEDIDDDLAEDVMEFRGIAAEGGTKKLEQEILREMSSNDPNQIFIRLIDNNNRLLYSTDTSTSQHLDIDSAALRNIHTSTDVAYNSIAHGDHKARIISAQLDGNTVIQIGNSTEDADEFMSLILNIFIATYLIVTIIASLAGWYIAKRSLAGVEAVSNAAIDVANGSLDRRVDIIPQSEEVHRLVETFNMMLDRIRELIIGMREMADNIAHDLRSPLARIRANAEGALASDTTLDEHRAAATDTIEECDRLLQLINTALDVSEAEVGISDIRREQVNLSDLVNDAYELFEPIAEDKHIKFYMSVQPGCHLTGHTQYLQRMLSNFLDNALKYTPPKGRVGLELISDNVTASITIHDTGIGIENDIQEKIFDRFYRCDESRAAGGNGLGLSFARAVVLAHGGHIILVSTPGHGSSFTIKIPF